MVKQIKYIFLLTLFLVGSFSCLPIWELPPHYPLPEEPDEPYLVAITNSVELNRFTVAERLGADPENSNLQLLPEQEIQVDALRYRTKDPQGNPVEASGIVAYPTSGVIRGVIVGEHYTIAADRESPTIQMISVEAALAMFGYVVICPDYLGFGATVTLPHPYLHAESSGRVSVDMVFAVREYMKQLGKAIDYPITVVGYSQGGYVALAFAQMAEERYAEQLPINFIFAGGGPYEPEVMMDLYIMQNDIDKPSVVPFTIVGLNYADQLNLDFSQIFLEPLLSNYDAWCVSKLYSLGQIDRAIGSHRMSDYMHPDMFTPELNPEFRKLYTFLRENSVIDWRPKAPLLLVHGTKDEVVPFVNAEHAMRAFQSAGSQVELIAVEADHKETAVSFYLAVLQRLVFNTEQ
ncbi:alpha/beta hydrolase [Parabacteroides sp. PF5-9]|uniref:alpha/beta hydrolase family protein n=1 Tax=Parabacteroides sp. PF5-9 TaxID=1742404 RepID=UPI0024762E7E|nr:alpha/beta hydrolase [Parabacteroides sp. PF5-9]MDH6358265.1 pimeloyl-ACP methyl ester carboxylesterase [Parabacteroides sp. PF5-9]